MSDKQSKLLISLLSVMLVSGLFLSVPAYSQNNTFRVALLGDTFGGGGFWDLSRSGVIRAGQKLGVKTKIVEMGTEPSKWEPAVRSLAAMGKYDLIITGAPPKANILKNVAPQFPQQKFLLFDAKLEGVPNVYSVTYAQNEGGFLGGVLAALVTNSSSEKLSNVNDKQVIGFIGLIDHPLINDFLTGYRQGAHYVDPDIKVLVSYVGSFNNPPKAKQLAKVQYSKGADIIFSAASANNIGVIEAAKNVGAYMIGCDANQNPLAPGVVLTSVLKKVGETIFNTIRTAVLNMDSLPFGTSERLEYPAGTGLAKDEYYAEYIPSQIKLQITKAEQKLNKGKIKVESTLVKEK